MKKNKLLLLSTILLVGILLSACTAPTTNWGSVSSSDTAVYYAGGAKVFALRPDNGNVIWSKPDKGAAGQLFLAAPAVAGDQVIAGDYLGGLTSFKASDGSVNWTFSDAKGKYVGGALVTPDLIIAPNADGNVYALDMAGNLKWTFTGGASFWSQPVTDGTSIFASSLDHFLYAVDPQSGAQVWKIDLGAPLVASPLLSNGVLYQGSITGDMNAVDAATGKVIWTHKVDAGIWSTPVLTGSNIAFGDQGTKITILNTADGSIVNTLDIGSAVIGDGTILGQTIMFGTESGNLVMVSQDGSFTTRNIGGKLYSNLVTNGTLVFVVETKGTVAMVALDENGNEKWNNPGK